MIFRENTEDVYAGIEYASGSEENRRLARFLRQQMGARFFEEAGLGVKPISPFGTKKRLDVWMHETIPAFDEIGINAGRRGTMAFLNPADAKQTLNAKVADLSM